MQGLHAQRDTSDARCWVGHRVSVARRLLLGEAIDRTYQMAVRQWVLNGVSKTNW